MNDQTGYSRKIEELIKKYRQFFSDPSPGQILATICPYTFQIDYDAFGLPYRRLDSWDFDRQMKEFAETAVKSQLAFMDVTDGLDNDYVPAVSMNFGYGVNSSYFTGAKVIMGDDTSWARPVLTDWENLSNLKTDRNTYWFQKILEGYHYLKDLCGGGSILLSAFCNAGPGDMANAVRGDALFYDMYDEPDYVRLLMDKCADAAIWLEEELNGLIGQINGGAVTANVWFPGNAPYLSEDFNDLCSPELYREFGRVYTQRILDHFGGAYIHHHAKGRHIHGDIASLRQLHMLEISWDPNCPKPVDDLAGLFEIHNDGGKNLPLMIRCRAEDVFEHIDELKRGRVVIMLNVDNLEQGKEVMRLIRKNSII